MKCIGKCILKLANQKSRVRRAWATWFWRWRCAVSRRRAWCASGLRPPGLAETVRLRGFCPADRTTVPRRPWFWFCPYNRPARRPCFEEHCSIKGRVLESWIHIVQWAKWRRRSWVKRKSMKFLLLCNNCTIQHCYYSSLLCNIHLIINYYATFTTYATIILILRTLSASRLCPPGQYLLADCVRLDSIC